MRDLSTRFKFHPRNEGLASSQGNLVPVAESSTAKGLDEWFYLLNAPPESFLELGNTQVFESENHAQDWIARHLPCESFQQGMALSFNLPFPGGHRHNNMSCVPADSASIQKYIDFLVKEIRLLGQYFGRETSVPYLHWFGDVIKLLTPAELTQLMFHINRAFKVLNSKDARLVFELDETPENDEPIALLSGLGFNTACINDTVCSSETSKNKNIRKLLDRLRSFTIESLFVRLKIGNDSHHIPKTLKQLLADQPTGVLLTPANQPPTAAQELILRQAREQLSLAGYRSVHKNFYILQEVSDHKVTHCLKGVGLGAVSYTKKYQICNTPKLDDYYSHLDNQKLPLFSITPLHSEI